MKRTKDIDVRAVTVHGAVGAAFGLAIIVLAVTLNVFDVGSLAQQTHHTSVFLLMMLFKPMMWFGTAAVAWSIWQQSKRETALVRSGFPQFIENQASQ